MKETKSKLPEGITQSMIDEAKAKHGADKVKLVEILNEHSDEPEKTVLAVVPTRNIVSMFAQYADSNLKKAQEILVKNCLLSHKDEVLADDALFLGAVNGIAELIPIRKVRIKNC
jgi:hypothetical protein